jgi:hypothetical protein
MINARQQWLWKSDEMYQTHQKKNENQFHFGLKRGGEYINTHKQNTFIYKNLYLTTVQKKT